MSKRNLTIEQEYEQYKSVFNFGAPAIQPLSNDDLINKKKIIEDYVKENKKAYTEINIIKSKPRKTVDDKMSRAYWKQRLELHKKLKTEEKALITLERINTELIKRSYGQRRGRSPPKIDQMEDKNVEQTIEQETHYDLAEPTLEQETPYDLVEQTLEQALPPE